MPFPLRCKVVVKLEKMKIYYPGNAYAVVKFLCYVSHSSIILRLPSAVNKNIYESAKKINDYANTNGEKTCIMYTVKFYFI